MNKTLLTFIVLAGLGAACVFTVVSYLKGKSAGTETSAVSPPPAVVTNKAVTELQPEQKSVPTEDEAVAVADEDDAEEAEAESGEAEGAPADPVWADYVDSENGFSFRYPRNLYLDDPCWDAKQGKLGDIQIPVEIYQDEKHLYVAAGHLISNASGKCEKTPTTAQRIQAFFRGEGVDYLGWRLTVVPVADKAALESYVKTIDPTCRVGKMTYRELPDDYEVTLEGAGEEDCFLEAERHIVYSEGHGKLAVFEGAQDCIFADERYRKEYNANIDNEAFQNEHCLDNAFVKSLRWGPGS